MQMIQKPLWTPVIMIHSSCKKKCFIQFKPINFNESDSQWMKKVQSILHLEREIDIWGSSLRRHRIKKLKNIQCEWFLLAANRFCVFTIEAFPLCIQPNANCHCILCCELLLCTLEADTQNKHCILITWISMKLSMSIFIKQTLIFLFSWIWK